MWWESIAVNDQAGRQKLGREEQVAVGRADQGKERCQERDRQRVGFVSFNQKFPESLARELDSVILGLLNGEIKTNVSPQKP